LSIEQRQALEAAIDTVTRFHELQTLAPLRLETAVTLVTNDVKLTKGVRDCIDKSGVRATYAHVDDIGVPAAPRYGRPRSDRVHGVIDWKNREVQWRLRQRRG